MELSRVLIRLARVRILGYIEFCRPGSKSIQVNKSDLT